jgi:hypothetical protein
MAFPEHRITAGPKRQTTELGGRHPAVQVNLFTPHSALTGTLQLSYLRLSDQLNFGPRIIRLEDAHLHREGRAAPAQSRVAYVHRDMVQVAVDMVSSDYAGGDPALREAKETVVVEADLGHFVVSGKLHLPRGADLEEWLVEGRLFVPLTDATIEGGPAGQVSTPIAIINIGVLGSMLA